MRAQAAQQQQQSASLDQDKNLHNLKKPNVETRHFFIVRRLTIANVRIIWVAWLAKTSSQLKVAARAPSKHLLDYC